MAEDLKGGFTVKSGLIRLILFTLGSEERGDVEDDELSFPFRVKTINIDRRSLQNPANDSIKQKYLMKSYFLAEKKPKFNHKVCLKNENSCRKIPGSVEV